MAAKADDEGLDGFLREPPSFLAEITRTNRNEFDVARRINRECHDLLFNKTNVRIHDLQAMLVATLFLRALQHYQATILLLSNGLVASGKVSLRALLEAVFAVRAVAASDENVRAYVNDDLIQRRKLIRKAKRCDHPILAKLRQAVSDDMVADLDRKIEESGAKELTTRRLSELAKLDWLYVSLYTTLSRAAHSNVGELDAYLIQGSNGEITEIAYAPSRDEVSSLLVTAGDFILLGVDAVCRQFDIDYAAKRTELSDALKQSLPE